MGLVYSVWVSDPDELSQETAQPNQPNHMGIPQTQLCTRHYPPPKPPAKIKDFLAQEKEKFTKPTKTKGKKTKQKEERF